ncbi:copper resistance CopC family protein [Neobacillus muris]|uniref:copper resistance CopC family protein n=1 Tax=Neobacillus muris TaxID=2941334 RepID=UPI00203FD858|nr:copper resistance CopC family protein [Neobacillus muris]
MRKIFFILISMLVMIPTIASAHTELISSNPASEQVVNGDLKEIVLTYGGKIESLSTMRLVLDGKEVPLLSVTPEENQLIAVLSKPLENGSYRVLWSIAGEDGHPITGEIPFKVQKEEKEEEQKTETKEPVTVKKEDSKSDEKKSVNEKSEKQSTDSSNVKTIITVAIVVIFLIGLFLLFRRKR